MYGARDIAHALGKPRREGHAWRCVCPLHGGHSLVLRDGENALLLKCWGGNCATEDILTELHRRGLIEARDQDRRSIRQSLSRSGNLDDHERRQHEKAAYLWSQRRPINGTIAEKYLQGRGITCPLQSTLAFLPPRKPEHHPAMIAAFSLPDEIEPGLLGAPRAVQAVHLTLLRSDGNGKADTDGSKKLFVGSPGYLPIVLAPPNDLLGMAITEGIEDALTVHQATGLGAWAAGAAGRMPALAETLPEWIECVTICAHADTAGQDGALALADALDRRGVEVFIEGVES